MHLKSILDRLTNSFHIVIGTGTQAAVIFYHFKTGHDLGPNVTNSLYAFYAFLCGHAFTYQKWPDKDGGQQ